MKGRLLLRLRRWEVQKHLEREVEQEEERSKEGPHKPTKSYLEE